MTLNRRELDALLPFWFPLLPVEQLGSEPMALMALGRRLVVWRAMQDPEAPGAIAVADDRCCHRSAQLSAGTISAEGCLVCPYHGWQFAADGKCCSLPQDPDHPIPSSFRIRTHQSQIRYGYLWVCLAPQARLPIPEISEADDPQFRLIHGFFETWRCSAFRVIENGLDNYHHFFVHRGQLDATSAIPAPLRDGIDDTDDGLRFSIPLDVVNNTSLRGTLDDGSRDLTVQRHVRWIAPLGLSLELHWPNGLRQTIVLFAVPQNERDTTILRFYLRNDQEEQVAAAKVQRFERGLIDQDRRILEGIVDAYTAAPTHECLIEADRPILLMRQRLRELFDQSDAAAEAVPPH